MHYVLFRLVLFLGAEDVLEEDVLGGEVAAADAAHRAIVRLLEDQEEGLKVDLRLDRQIAFQYLFGDFM